MEGTEFEQFGDGLEAAMVLSVVSEGMPLIYNGQEAGNPRRLAFFEKDPITWREHPLGDLYKKLFALKKKNTALWNGKWGARMINVPNSAQTQVLSFVRRNEANKVFAVLNFSAQPQTMNLSETLYYGAYHEYFSGEAVEFSSPAQVELMPWEYRVYVSG
jgi:1,4-alpha-glucan branching enzyme